ncbi:MAG: hypothetical protein DMF00_14925 [Verrucomicrobia bacterium]|nr:MAG: hypothetical protein DMF00_14925 [Verrucomicrobiota bacterium]
MNSQLSPVRRKLGKGGTFNPQPSVELHIDELVLHGFAPTERHAIGDTVESELRELLVKQQSLPLSLANREIDRIDAGEFEIASGAAAPTSGRRVAEAINRALVGLARLPQRRT